MESAVLQHRAHYYSMASERQGHSSVLPFSSIAGIGIGQIGDVNLYHQLPIFRDSILMAFAA